MSEPKVVTVDDERIETTDGRWQRKPTGTALVDDEVDRPDDPDEDEDERAAPGPETLPRSDCL